MIIIRNNVTQGEKSIKLRWESDLLPGLKTRLQTDNIEKNK